jgi:hypothetical protein
MADSILKNVSTEDLIAELYNRPGVVRSVFTIADMENQLEEDEDTADLPSDVKEKIATAFIHKIRGDL